jgi:hypothetical protein
MHNNEVSILTDCPTGGSGDGWNRPICRRPD